MSRIVAAAALVLVTGAVLSPVFGNGFVFDDENVIVNGDYIHDSARIPEFFTNPTMYVNPIQRGKQRQVDTYRPVTLVTFVWDSALSGRTPWAYHLTNLLAHLMTVVLVLLLGCELFGSVNYGRALAAATFFALTPLPAAAHIWINGRSDVFCTLFGLAGILLWRRALATTDAQQARRVALHLLAALVFLAGLMAKEVLLLALPALWLWPTQQAVSLRRRTLRCGGLIVAALVYFAARTMAIGGLRAHRDSEQLVTALTHLPVLLWDGLLHAIVPIDIHLRFLDYSYGQLEGVHFAGLALLTVAAAYGLWRVRKTLPIMAWGVLWFASTLAPVAIITTMLWPGFGRYLYLPCVGLALGLAEAGALLLRRHPNIRRPLLLGAGAYAAVLAFVLSLWVVDYRDSEALYTAAIDADPELGPAYGWLGMSFVRDERFSEALGPLAIAHERSPEEPRYLTYLGEAATRLGDREAMARIATEGISLYDEPGYFHVMLVNLYNRDHPAMAAENVVECLRKDPSDAECGQVLTALLTRHPLRLTYRDHVAGLLELPQYAALAVQVRPLFETLPPDPR